MKSNIWSKHRKGILRILSAAGVLIILFLPFIVEKFYYMKAPCKLFETNYEVKDILGYYGSVLSFAGATILGILTLLQNKKAQEKSDEVNRLQLELQKKSMAMAEAQYAQNDTTTKVVPKFEMSFIPSSGSNLNLLLKLKNASSFIVSNIIPISFVVMLDDGTELSNTGPLTISQHTLPSLQTTVIQTHSPDLSAFKQHSAKLSLAFSCEDERCTTYYYRASIQLPSAGQPPSDLWTIKQVG